MNPSNHRGASGEVNSAQLSAQLSVTVGSVAVGEEAGRGS